MLFRSEMLLFWLSFLLLTSWMLSVDMESILRCSSISFLNSDFLAMIMMFTLIPKFSIGN